MTLRAQTGGYSIPAFEIGLRSWKLETGGGAEFVSVPFNDKARLMEQVIAEADASWDLHYMYDAFMQRFGTRLLLPLEGAYSGDLGDFLPVALKDYTTQTDQVLRALPVHFGTALWDWNASLFEQIGEDGEHPPTTYAALFDLAPKFRAAGFAPCAQPWLGEGGAYAAQYFKIIFNSTGGSMFSEDRTEVRFDGDAGLQTFRTIEAGLQSGWWDAESVNLSDEREALRQFSRGAVATIVHSEPDPETPVEGHRSGPFPGIAPGTTGSVATSDGLGVSRFSRQQPAAWSFFNRLFTTDVAREISLSETRYPPARLSLIRDPEVVALQPLLPAYEAQARGPVDAWSTPYDYAPIFDAVIARLVSGEYTADQAHEAAVRQTEELIAAYLNG